MRRLVFLACSLVGGLLTLGASACQRLPDTAPTSLASVTTIPTQPSTPMEQDRIAGSVLDQAGKPVEGAIVRIQASQNFAASDAQGRFVLRGLEAGKAVTVSAWKDGYYCTKQEMVTPPTQEVQLRLRLYQTTDNPDYAWVPPTGENSCYSCKPGVTQIWLDNDAHGKSALNPRFLSMYNGTDLQGRKSPPVRYAQGDYGKAPVPPDLSQPYFGPGYKLNFPNSAGNCAACHIPGAAIADPYGVDPNQAEGVDKFGVHCDFCHKIAAVRLDSQTGLPYPNRPGVLSMDIRRPFPEDKDRYQIFFGTFDDDNVPQEDTRLPLISQSQFCAPCHYGAFWDIQIYNSYGEWLASPYSDPQTGKTCQACHMPAPSVLNGQTLTNVAPGKGGVERSPDTIHAHTFPGANSQELLQKALTMQVSARREGQQVIVEVNLTNDQTGHHIPSDSPLRQMILLVEAQDEPGNMLALEEGERVPEWGGVGDPQKGYYAGLPGKGFAKVLAELWTDISPSGAYWNQTRLMSDNRLAAFATDTSRYVFAGAPSGSSKISVRLIYRRAFRSLADQKGWQIPDILMEATEIDVK
jgi:Carboxypeptidase regulatory-like domain